ncbi:MAG: GNAT family protein [Cyclobacteriaceae bacterium]
MEQSTVTLRELKSGDADRMVELANNENVSINLRDQFPHPYTRRDAERFLKLIRVGDQISAFAIESNGTYVGNIGLIRETDVYKNSAELGYFLGEPYWNQGVMTKAIVLALQFGFETLDLNRVHCGVFEFNKASQRVLEKAGFIKEGIFKQAVFKKGQFWDEIRYAKLRPKS